MKAGCPPEAFSYYPADHAGAGEILRRTGRSMFFGDVSAVGGVGRRSAGRAARPRLQQGPDRRRSARATLGCSIVDLIAASIADNGGRSCVNASGVWVAASHAEARRRGARGEAGDDRAARRRRRARRRWRRSRIPRVAERISRRSTPGCDTPGRARSRSIIGAAPRLATLDGCTYLQPTRRALRHARPSAGQPRVPVPVRRGRQGHARRDGADAGADGQDAGRDGADARPRAGRPPARLAARRPPERRRRSRPTSSAGISRTRATCSSTSTRAGRSSSTPTRRSPRPPTREDPVVHGRRRQHVLRQLPARQRARRRAARPRPRRRADAGLHADPDRRAQRQPGARCSSAGSASSSSSTSPLFRHTPRCLRSAVGFAVGHPAGHQASDQGRSRRASAR